MTTDRAYLLISGRLYLVADTTDPDNCLHPNDGNLYPCALGTFTYTGALGWLKRAAHGDTVTLFGRRYEVNCLPTDGTCEDEIDLELVLLCEPGDPERADFDALLSRPEVDQIDHMPGGRLRVVLAPSWWLDRGADSQTDFDAGTVAAALAILDSGAVYQIEQ